MTPAEKSAVLTAADLALEAARVAKKATQEARAAATTQTHQAARAAAAEAFLAANAAEEAALALDAEEADEDPEVRELHLCAEEAACEARWQAFPAQMVGESRPAATEAAEAIARRILRLQTLETRCSDSLDFHDLPVWALQAALEAAFAAGRASCQA